MTTRWGILGLGSIANQFAEDLKVTPDAVLHAVGSRSAEKARAFGDKHDAPVRHASYADLANDPDVDIIYIATPHPMHAQDMELCIQAGKPVVCEKPFTVNAAEASRVINLAREKRVFLMEGMWSRFFPLMAVLRDKVADGAIGEPRLLQADFGFRAGFNAEGRLFKPELGGGALLDVGCYVISLAYMLLGEAVAATGVATMGETGVDEQCAISLRHRGGELSVLSTAVRTNTGHDAILYGTEGSVRIRSPWWHPESMTITRGESTDEILCPYRGNGFNYEASEAMRCLASGLTESNIMPHDESLAIIKTMDSLRAQWGLKYPSE